MEPDQSNTRQIIEQLERAAKALETSTAQLDEEKLWRKRAKQAFWAGAVLLAAGALLLAGMFFRIRGAEERRTLEHRQQAVEVDCRFRRALSELPPPPDSTRSCVEQTPPQLQATGGGRE